MRNNTTHWRGKQEEQQLQESKEKLSPFTKRILIVDDDPDITFTFKKAFEEANRISGSKISFHVNTYNDPLLALSELKPDFYDLMLVDIEMPKMNGFDFCVKVFEVDLNPKVCFIFISINKSRSIKRTVSIIEFWLFYRTTYYNRQPN